MSQPTSGQQQIAQTCQFWSCSGRDLFLDNGSIDFKSVYSFEKGDSSALFHVCNPLYLYTFLLFGLENGAQMDQPWSMQHKNG